MGTSLKLAEVDRQLAETTNDTLNWQAGLRAAMVNSITAEDVKEIMAKQVERAKAGDQAAIKFIMTQALGVGTPIIVKQTNLITDVETAAKIARESQSQGR